MVTLCEISVANENIHVQNRLLFSHFFFALLQFHGKQWFNKVTYKDLMCPNNYVRFLRDLVFL